MYVWRRYSTIFCTLVAIHFSINATQTWLQICQRLSFPATRVYLLVTARDTRSPCERATTQFDDKIQADRTVVNSQPTKTLLDFGGGWECVPFLAPSAASAPKATRRSDLVARRERSGAFLISERQGCVCSARLLLASTAPTASSPRGEAPGAAGSARTMTSHSRAVALPSRCERISERRFGLLKRWEQETERTHRQLKEGKGVDSRREPAC